MGSDFDPLASGLADEVGNVATVEPQTQPDVPAVSLSLNAFKGASPDEVSTVDQLAKSNGAPFDLVFDRTEEFKKADAASKAADAIYEKDNDGNLKYPNAAKFFEDPINLGKGHDDIESLQKIEQSIKSQSKPFDPLAAGLAVDPNESTAGRTTSYLSTLGEGAIQSLTYLPKAVTLLTHKLDLFGAEKGTSAEDNPFYEMLSDIEKIPKDIPNNEKYTDEFGGQVMKGLGQLMGTVATGGATGLAERSPKLFALLNGISQEATAAYEEARGKGASEDDAFKTASATGLLAGPLDAIVPGHMMERLMKGGGGKVTKALVELALEAGTEALTEGGQSIIENAVAKKIYDSDRSYWDGALESGAVGGVTATIASLIVSGATGVKVHVNTEHHSKPAPSPAEVDLVDSHLRNVDGKVTEIQNAEQSIAHMDEIRALAQSSKLNERDPEAVAAFIDENLKQHGVAQTVTVDAVKLAEVFYQGQTDEGVTPGEDAASKDVQNRQTDLNELEKREKNFKSFAKAVGVSDTELDRALLSHGNIEINTAKLVSKFANDPVYKAVTKQLKDGVANQKEALQNDIKTFNEKLDALKKQSIPEVQALRNQLTLAKDKGGQGWNAEHADIAIANAQRMVADIAARKGLTTEEYLKQSPIELRVNQESGKLEALVKPNVKTDTHSEDTILASETDEAIMARTKVGDERNNAFTARAEAAKRIVSGLQKGDVVHLSDGRVYTIKHVFKNGDVDVKTEDGQDIIQKSFFAEFIPTSSSPDVATVKRGNDQSPPLFQNGASPAFYSQLTKTIEALPQEKMTVGQLRAALSKGVKPDEIKWTGFEELLSKGDGEKITKSEALKIAQENAVQVQEVTKGEYKGEVIPQGDGTDPMDGMMDIPKDSETKFHKYQLDGGQNYRELLFTLPHSFEKTQARLDQINSRIEEITKGSGKDLLDLSKSNPTEYKKLEEEFIALRKEGDALAQKARNGETGEVFKSAHFSEPNILAHVRFNERTDADGKRVLFLEEIQSDWHQKGRKEGYKNDSKPSEFRVEKKIPNVPEGKNPNDFEPYYRVYHEPSGSVYGPSDVNSEAEALKAAMELHNRQRTPDAPFKKTWHEMVMKRMLRYAAENGFDKVAWTTGEQQNERYDLSKQIDSVYYQKQDDGTFHISVMGKDGHEVIAKEHQTEAELENLIGKEVAKKIVNGEGQVSKGDSETGDTTKLSNLDLKIGGQGMKGFYDKILPDFVNKYAKKWGAKVVQDKVAIAKERQVYTGPEYSLEKLKEGLAVANKGGPNVWESPFTGEKMAYPVNRVSVASEFRDTIEAIKNGKTFAEAVAMGSRDLADVLGGKIETAKDPATVTAHSVDITPSMHESVMQGQALFQSNHEVLFQGNDSEKNIDAQFSKLANEAITGNRRFKTPIPVAENTPAVLRAVGAKGIPLIIDQGTLTKAINKHQVNANDLLSIPQEIRNPVMVFESKSQGFNVVTTFKNAKGDIVVAAIHLEKNVGNYRVNEIATMSKRSPGELKNWLDNKLLKYVDKKRATELLQSVGLQLPEEGSYQSPTSKILTKEDVVKQGNALTQGETNPRGAIEFVDGKTIIHLAATADASTFQHEMMHHWSKEIQSLIKSGQADEETVKMWQTLKNFVGAKAESLTREQEEKLARGFEAYLMEGKAPAVELVDAFNRFKKWLTEIYKNIKNLNVEINDDVRMVFDRILASEEELKQARQYYALNESVAKLITKDRQKQGKLVAASDKANTAQEVDHTKDAMSAFIQAQGGSEGIKKRATKEIDAMPMFKLLSDAEKKPISLDALKQSFGEETAKKIAGNFPFSIKSDGTVSIESIAADYGFDSVDELIKQLESSPDRDTAISQRANEIVNGKENEIKGSQTAQDVTKADEAIHNDETLSSLVKEAKTLSEEVKLREGAKKYQITEKVYKDLARDQIASMPVGEATQYSKFAYAEKKHGAEVVRLLLKDKKKEALEARMKQILNHALVRESIRAREELAKIQAKYAPKKLDGALKNIESEYINPVIELLSRYGLTEKKNAIPYDLLQIKELDSEGSLYDFIPEFARIGEKN
jgi:hypothetical protein